MIRSVDTSADSAGPMSSFLPGVELGFKDKNGEMIGPEAGLSWVRPVPWGFAKLLDWAYKR